MKGRVVIVTGGGSGIGLATAELLGRCGASVALAGRSIERLEAAAKRLVEAGIECFHAACDVREASQAQDFTRRTLERFSRVDGLVNNAGGQFPTMAEDLTTKGWEAVIRTNLTGTWNMTHAVAVGANVRVYNPMLMTKFESKALKRTFDEIYFGMLTPDGADAANAGGPALADGTNPHAGVTAPTAEAVTVGKVEKAAGADAYTIAEAWAKKDALSGKVIAIRGVVVKYNAQVMGKNWVHLQDGSGDAAKNTNDITVVTMDETAKGQTITIRGTVKTSKDYGAGYKYAIIIEDAKIVK